MIRLALTIAAIGLSGPVAASELRMCPPNSSISVWYNAATNVSTIDCGHMREMPTKLPGKKCHVYATGQSFLKDRYVGRPQDPDDTGFCIQVYNSGQCHIECED